MDDAIWPTIIEMEYFERTTPLTEAEIKEKITGCWNELSIDTIGASISSWMKIVRSVCDANDLATDLLRLKVYSQRCILMILF